MVTIYFISIVDTQKVKSQIADIAESVNRQYQQFEIKQRVLNNPLSVEKLFDKSIRLNDA